MSSESHTPTPQPDDEIDLLDLFLICSENLKALFIFPLLGLLLACSVVFWQSQKPKTYVSTSSIALEKPTTLEKSLVLRPEVLVSIINTGAAFADIRATAQINASLGRTDRFVNIAVSSNDADIALAGNQAVLSKIYEITALSGPEADRLRNLLQSEQMRLAEIKKMIAESNISSQESPDAVRTYGELLTLASGREFAIAKMEQELTGLSSKDVILPPSAAQPTAPPRKTLPLAAGVIGGGLIALLWIFLRHAIRGIKQDPVQRAKLHQLKRNLKLKT